MACEQNGEVKEVNSLWVLMRRPRLALSKPRRNEDSWVMEPRPCLSGHTSRPRRVARSNRK